MPLIQRPPTKIYDKRDDFDFDGHVPRASSCGIYISQLIRIARSFRRQCP